MAARRGKSQARRNGSGGLPGWAWLVAGVLVTLLAVLMVPRWLKSDGATDGFFRPQPNPDALPAASNEDGEAIAPDTAPAAAAGEDKPATQFDFYTLLPGEETAMSDAELAASAKAEADAQAKAAQQVQPETAAAETLPAALDENAPATAATATAATETTPA